MQPPEPTQIEELFPNWMGTDIDRFFAIRSNKLTLSTPPLVFDGIPGSAVLLWEKRNRIAFTKLSSSRPF